MILNFEFELFRVLFLQLRMLFGQEDFKLDRNILDEGYRFRKRTKQFGQYTQRNPYIIDNKSLYRKVVGRTIRKLVSRGPDRHINKHFTFQVTVHLHIKSTSLPYPFVSPFRVI